VTDHAYAALNKDGSIYSQDLTKFNNNMLIGNGWEGLADSFFAVAIYPIFDKFIALSDDGTVAQFPNAFYAEKLPGWEKTDTGTYTQPVKGWVGIQPGYSSFSAINGSGFIACHALTIAHIKNCPTDGGYVDLYATGQITAYAGRKADGTVSLWGGDGNDVHSIHVTKGGRLPLAYIGHATKDLTNVVRIITNQAAFVAMKSDGSLTCWGVLTSGGAKFARHRLHTCLQRLLWFRSDRCRRCNPHLGHFRQQLRITE
jgi:hypothetical protein